MSATMHLYRPLKGFEFVPAKKEDRLELVKACVTDDRYHEFCERTRDLDELEWEKKYCGYIPGYDEEKHGIIEVSMLTKGYSRSRIKSRRLYQNEQYIKSHFKDYLIKCDYYDRIDYKIICEEISYRQGWFFKSSFLNKVFTENYAFDKYHLRVLLENILNFKAKKNEHGKWALEAYREFTNKFEDGMIFVVMY